MEEPKEQVTSSKNQLACSWVAFQAHLCVLHRILVLETAYIASR
jgi:hypothetical protein